MKTRINLPEIDVTVFNPVLIQIVNDISKEFGIVDEPYISLEEDVNIKKTRGNKGTIGSTGLKRLVGANDNLSNGFIITSFKRRFLEGNANSLLNVRPDSDCILEDKEIGFEVKPIYFKEIIELSIDYINTSKTFLETIVTGLKSLASFPGLMINHNLEYTYSLPPYIKALILNIASCKNKKLNELLTFKDYFENIAKSNMTYRTSETDNSIQNLTLAVKERQCNVFGIFDESIIETEIEEDDQNKAYKISFNYEVEFLTPVSLYLKYPIMVYNTRLNKNFLQVVKNYSYPNHNNALHGDQGLLSSFSSGIGPFTNIREPYSIIPSYDDRLEYRMPKEFQRIFSMLLIVDDQNPYNLININDQDIPLKKELIDFIKKSEKDYIGSMYRSIVYFTLYENDSLDRSRKVILNNDDELVVDKILDNKKIYRLVCYIVNDLNYISTTDLERIKSYINFDYKTKYDLFKLELNTYGKTGFKPRSEKEYQNYLIEISDIRNKFLSTLDVFIDYYNLNQEEVKKIIEKYQDPFTVFVKFKNKEISTMKTVQVSSLLINRKE